MIKTAQQLVDEADAEIETVPIDEARALSRDEKTLFVDLRDIRELWREGTIPGATHAPRGMLEFWVDPSCKYHRKEFDGSKKLLLFCASAWRSALAAKALQDMGLQNVAHMQGGFSAWKAAGLEIKPVLRHKPKPKGRF